MQRIIGRPRRWKIVVLFLLVSLIVGGLAIGLVFNTRPDPEVVTLYACVRNSTVIWVGTREPASCPSGSEMIVDDYEVVDRDRSIRHRLTVVLRSWLSIPGVMAVLVVASLFWLRAGWDLALSRRVLWFMVPLLAFVAAACVAGPGHWFPKEPWEGPSVISLGARDAITVLDLVGLVIAALAVALAAWLAANRWGSRER